MPFPLLRSVAMLGAGLVAISAANASATDPERNGPSFDCRRASTSIEKKICASAPLSSLDGQIGLRYGTLYKSMDKPSAEKLKQDQKWFIVARDASSDDRDGLVMLLRQRLKFLNSIGWSAPPGIEGVWSNTAGEIVVSRGKAGTLNFHANAAEPAGGRWVCEAQGTLSSTAAKRWKEVSNDPADQMQFQRTGMTLDVAESDAGSSPNCGLNGSLAGSYFRTGNAPK